MQPPDIVVSGVRDREEQVRGFVRALTAEPRGGTLSRFAESVCPTVIGLSPAQDKAVAADPMARGSFWWLVGVVVVAGVILAVLL